MQHETFLKANQRKTNQKQVRQENYFWIVIPNVKWKFLICNFQIPCTQSKQTGGLENNSLREDGRAALHRLQYLISSSTVASGLTLVKKEKHWATAAQEAHGPKIVFHIRFIKIQNYNSLKYLTGQLCPEMWKSFCESQKPFWCLHWESKRKFCDREPR